MAVILETSLGDITVDLYTEERPRCCLNFLKLCKIKYYNFCLFHSVQRNLVAQSGDPTGSGKGGNSVFGTLYGEQARFFEAEVKPRIKHKKRGTLSMVNNGENMHGSQFFLTLTEDIDYLDNKHTVFGEVAEGFEVLQKFNEVFADKDGKPYKDVRIFHTVILDDPYDDPDGLSAHIPDRSPEPTKEQLESGRIGVDENIDDFEGKTEMEIEEMVAEREAKARTQILEMIGDLPDTEVAPPDTVLFVCKLNPVTTEEDLEIIFSRFGQIKSCEVIKDQKTEESLQYAFIEFEKPEECENAYFKMDNVLIDDRRIHVDFSQSVAKFKWKGKGKGVEYAKKDEDEDKPQFIIKDRSRKDKYELVFDSEEDTSSKKHKKKKKSKLTEKRNKPDRRSPSPDRPHNKRKYRRSRSAERRRRSQSPQERGKYSKHSYDSQAKDKYPKSSHHREDHREHREDRSRERRRDYSPSRHRHGRDADRSEYRDRYGKTPRDRDSYK